MFTSRTASAWLSKNIRHGWASCPISQIGCILIMSQPAYPNVKPATPVADRLRAAAGGRHHEFWAADTNLLEGNAIDWSGILSPRHVTDECLLALAVSHAGRFVTFDRGVPLAAVPAAGPGHLEVIA
jgi:hypothetical protein